MKSLYNKYQALVPDEDVQTMNREVFAKLGVMFANIVNMGYQPVEVEGYLHSMISYIGSEARLRRGLDLRKQERENKK